MKMHLKKLKKIGANAMKLCEKDFVTDFEEFKILSAPIPLDFDTLSYFKKLKYLPLILKKNKILREREKTLPDNVFKNEFVIYAPGRHIEFFRCTSVGLLKELVANMKEKIIEVNLTTEVSTLVIRVGENMKTALDDLGVVLVIKDVQGEEIAIQDIKSDILTTNKYSTSKE